MPSRFLTETQKYDILQEWVLASKAPPSQNREIVLLPSKPYSKQARLLVMFFLFSRDWIVSESVFILQSTRKVKSYFSKLKLRGNWSPERLANFFSVLSRENSWSLSGGEGAGADLQEADGDVPLDGVAFSQSQIFGFLGYVEIQNGNLG